MKFKNLKNILLVAIVLVAAILRLWNLSKIPVSLFGDEVDVGYQAYSILKTGKDYYGNFLPTHFHSLAEYRTPLYLYASVPTVAIFGISPLGVRLPAALFGIASIPVFYLLVKKLFNNEKLALLASALLAFSPWHIQYSRGGFEVTQLIFFLLLGLYFFYKSLENGKNLWIAMVFFALTPWVYSTAKLFTPLLMVFLFIIYFKKIWELPKKHLIYSVIALLVVGGPIAYSTIFSGGTERFGYISVFSNPIIEPEVGVARLNDAKVRGESGLGLRPTLIDRLYHNKFTFWHKNIFDNVFQSYSFDFLFNEGDLNVRHSIPNMGQMYKPEVLGLVAGIILFFSSKSDKKLKLLLGFWLIVGILPAAITRDGGMHATRLILVLPPLLILTSLGLLGIYEHLKGKPKLLYSLFYVILFVLSFAFYQHEYWYHYPWQSERWWHAGFSESFNYVKNNQQNYDKVIISTANEPPWVFFAGLYPYPPQQWQENFPLKNEIYLDGIGIVSHIDKFYFGNFGDQGLYDWGKYLDNRTLFMATQKEVNIDLSMDPGRVPGDLKLLQIVKYPSGEPAFYFLTGTKEPKND